MRFFIIILVLSSNLISCKTKLSEVIYYDNKGKLVERYVFSNDSIFVIDAIAQIDTVYNFYVNEHRIKCRYILSGSVYGPFEIDKDINGISYKYLLPDSGVKKTLLEYSFSAGNYYVDDIYSAYRNINSIKRNLIDTTTMDNNVLYYKNTVFGYGDDSRRLKNYYWIDYVSVKYGVLTKTEFYKDAEAKPYRVIQGKFLFRHRYK